APNNAALSKRRRERSKTPTPRSVSFPKTLIDCAKSTSFLASRFPMRRISRWMNVGMSVLVGVAGATLQIPVQADSVPFWGARASVVLDTPIDRLKSGEFLWLGDAVTSGPLVMVVSISEQRGYVYRNGVLIGATSVSPGRPGHSTPVGIFTVLQK